MFVCFLFVVVVVVFVCFLFVVVCSLARTGALHLYVATGSGMTQIKKLTNFALSKN